MTSTIQIAIAIVELDDQILIGRRLSDQVLAGKWEFPGGKIEPGESSTEAVRRECMEETGLIVDAGPLWQTVLHTYPHGVVRLHFHRCRPVDPIQADQSLPSPQAPFRWVPRDRLVDFDFPAANADVLRRLMQ